MSAALKALPAASSRQRHPTEVAREALFLRVPKAKRQWLTAALAEISAQRQALHHDDVKLQVAHAAKRMLHSTVGLQERYDSAFARTEKALNATIDACFRAGVRDDDAIATFAREDFEHTLRSYTSSHFSPMGSAAVSCSQGLHVRTGAHASRVSGQVLLARQAFEDGQPDRVEQLYRRWKRKPWIAYPTAIGGTIFAISTALVAWWPKVSPYVSSLGHLLGR